MTSSVRLIVVSDEQNRPGHHRLMLEACQRARPGSVAVVLRDKEWSVARRRALGLLLREATIATGQLLIVADRIDLALALGADGIHLPADGVLPSEARGLGAFGWLSRAHHGVLQLPPEELLELNCVLVSPVLEDRKGRVALGVDGLRRRSQDLRARHPAVRVAALGGVSSEQAQTLTEAGADCLCVMGGLVRPGEPHRLVSALRIDRPNSV